MGLVGEQAGLGAWWAPGGSSRSAAAAATAGVAGAVGAAGAGASGAPSREPLSPTIWSTLGVVEMGLVGEQAGLGAWWAPSGSSGGVGDGVRSGRGESGGVGSPREPTSSRSPPSLRHGQSGS